MKHILTLLIVLQVFSSSSAQFVATMEITEPIEGLCNDKKVYALFPMLDGQEKAVCPVSDNEIAIRINNEVGFLKQNPKY